MSFQSNLRVDHHDESDVYGNTPRYAPEACPRRYGVACRQKEEEKSLQALGYLIF